jgi:hypothetical protein
MNLRCTLTKKRAELSVFVLLTCRNILLCLIISPLAILVSMLRLLEIATQSREKKSQSLNVLKLKPAG